MRALLFVCLSLAAAAAAQSRVDDFAAGGLEVDEVHLTPLPDGGCSARWCGSVASSDAGATLAACTDTVGRALRFDLDAGVP